MLESIVRQQEDEIKSLQEERNSLQSRLSEINHGFSRCPCGWTEYLVKCYWISSSTKTWHEAKEDCKAKEAELVVINRKCEQNLLSTLDTAEDQVWIGLQHQSAYFSSGWSWVDGSPLRFHNWDVQQPDDEYTLHRRQAECVYADRERLDKWHNAPCTESHRWVCQKELK
ncbi:asialoglycoprotein receptor 1-like [Myripristis murdjan]|uniref:asialoglycoprotein receptor 1-like n=1 Tax=Myripristis murdjan TaxID=586833 RepID=UPI001175D05F|nr:asialoglycoprotein receptor 1-like [Myripristis murdjan]